MATSKPKSILKKPAKAKEPVAVEAVKLDANGEPKRKIIKVRKERSTSTRGHYVTNAQLIEAIAEDKLNKDAANPNGKLSSKLAKYLWMIAERYSYSPSFANYSFREDMVSIAVVNLCANWYKFNPEKSDNPFAFYTTAAYRSFLQYLADEKKHREIRDSLLVEAGSQPSFAFQEKSRAGVTHDESAFRASSED